jgi:hypothetical protein
MTAWLAVLLFVAASAAFVAILARRATDGADETLRALDDLRRDVGLVALELRVEHDRVARRRAALARRGTDGPRL